jgi:hypothetical protein
MMQPIESQRLIILIMFFLIASVFPVYSAQDVLQTSSSAIELEPLTITPQRSYRPGNRVAENVAVFSEQEIQDMYVGSRMSSDEIGTAFNCDGQTISPLQNAQG